MSLQSFLVLLLVGAIAGALADYFVGGLALGLAGAIIVGVIGAFIGSWLFAALGVNIAGGLISEIITAFVGALILLLLLRAIRR
jgi:uncharacterized membrane protein YeaQ/YmgE (transglycosylase-associated protein family)